MICALFNSTATAASSVLLKRLLEGREPELTTLAGISARNGIANDLMYDSISPTKVESAPFETMTGRIDSRF